MDFLSVYDAKAAEYLLAAAYILIGFPFFAYVLEIEIPFAEYLPGWSIRKR